MICDQHDIQKVLPQVAFVSESILKRADWAALLEDLSEHVHVKRVPQGWIHASQHNVMLRLVG